MNLLKDIGKLCICRDGPTVPGCPEHAPVYGEPLPIATPQSTHAMLVHLIRNQEKIMAAIDDLNTSLAQESTDLGTLGTVVTTFIADVKTALDSNDIAAAKALVDQHDAAIQQAFAQLQANDPAPAPAGDGTNPGDGSTTVTTGDGTDGTTPAA